MPKICVKSGCDGTHSVNRGDDPIVSGLSLDEAENYAAFVRASARIRRTRRLPEAARSRGAGPA